VAPQVIFSPFSISTLGGGFYAPFGVAADASGNIYVADDNYGTGDDGRTFGAVKEIPAGCASSACVRTLGGRFVNPEASLAVDGSGNVYMVDGLNVVKEMPAGCASSACVKTVDGALPSTSVAVDGRGNLYGSYLSSVWEMPAGCTSSACVRTVNAGFTQVSSVAVDGRGNLYVADFGLVKESPAGCASSACLKTLGGQDTSWSAYVWSVAVDVNGNVYVADWSWAAVREIPTGCASSACVTTLFALSGGWDPNLFITGVAVDGAGNVYVASTADGTVKEINRASPPSVAFAATAAGTKSSDSPRTVTVTNFGNANLTFPVPSPGSNPSITDGFSVDSSTTCPQLTAGSASATLAPGKSCNYAVDFTPPATGDYSGNLTLTDNALYSAAPGYARQSIPLFGFVPPSMTSPVPGSVLSGSSAMFTWKSLASARSYKLKLGTRCAGCDDVYNGGPISGTSATVSNIPTHGDWIYARLYYLVGSAWGYYDATYTEAGLAAPPTFSTPAPGSTLSGSSATFTWTPGEGAYKLKLGTFWPGSDNIYNGGAIAGTSAAVSKIPTTGNWLYARLYYLSDGIWKYIDATYTEAGTSAVPAFITPVPGSTIWSNTTFTWTPGEGAYKFKLGTLGPGSDDVYNGAAITGTSVTDPNIPCGAKLYARLYYLSAGTWLHIDATYSTPAFIHGGGC
jgi:hypothetical protein